MLWPIAFFVAAGLLVIATGAVVWFAAQRRALAARCEELSRQLDERNAQVQSYRDEIRAMEQQIAETRKDLAVVTETRRHLTEQFDKAQKQLRETFDSLAGDALKKNNEQFLQLAAEKLKAQQTDAAAELEKRKTAVETLLKPIRQSLEQHAKAVSEIEKQREGAYHGLRQLLTSMNEAQDDLRGQTANLVKALRRPEVRGRWGESQLRRVAELAGMIDHCDFFEQQTIQTDGGALRPDMIVKLPGDGTIVVDAGTQLDAFFDALETDDDEVRQQHLERHVRQIESKVRDLSAKRYDAQFERSPAFVVLFINLESSYQEAMRLKPTLQEEAFGRDVIIATPATLIGLLRVVAMTWREERIAENARKISQLGSELHERIAIAADYLQKLGRSLESVVNTYNQFVGSFESRVAVTARKFKELGADSRKELPAEGQIKPIETTPRQAQTVSE